MRWIAASLSGPTRTRSIGSAPKSSATVFLPATSTPTRSLRRRRSANSSTAAVGASSQCASSIATSTVVDEASSRSAPSSARPTPRWSGARPRGSSSRSATSSACRRGSGRSASTSSSTSSSRSPSAAYESCASLPAGRHASTRNPRSRAASTAACQSVVFPMPGSPSSTNAHGPSAAWPRNALSDSRSCSRAKISTREASHHAKTTVDAPLARNALAAERVSAGDDFEDLLRDLGLTCAVHREREVVDQLAGRLRGVAHRRHARALLGRGGLEQRAVDLRLEVDRQQPLEDLLRLGLEDEVADEPVVVALVVGGLEHVLGDRQHVRHGDALDERRDEVVVDEHDTVDVLVDVELGQPVRDRLRVGVVRVVAEASPLAVELEAREAQRRDALAPDGEPTHVDVFPLQFARERR